MKTLLLILISTLTILSCSEQSSQFVQEDVIISNKRQFAQSTTAGNLITTAIRQVNKLDIVLYPTEFLYGDTAGLLSQSSQGMNESDTQNIMSIFPSGKRDAFRVGYMKGSDIKTFIRNRTLERFAVDFEVAGANYDIQLKGGVVVSEQYGFENSTMNNEQRFLVAISDALIRPGVVFPPYLYRNSIDRIFDATDKVVSAKKSLEKFLEMKKVVPLLKRARANVRNTKSKDLGFRAINQIQGDRFMSPLWGNIVTTKGIVTVSAKAANFPFGFIIYIQSQRSDSNPRTSEAIKLFYKEDPNLEVGDEVKVKGVVYEESNNAENSLTSTSLREISLSEKISTGNSLPDSVYLDKIPQKSYSTHVGNLNLKKKLNLNDAIDFWESLEGMRVKIKNPKITGFRGGKETLADEKRNLTLYAIPETQANKLTTPSNGVYIKPDKHIYNPDMITIATGPLTKGLDIKAVHNVGDVISGEIEGLITFTKNIFGEGEYLFQIPWKSQALEDFYNQKSGVGITALEQRPAVNYLKTQNSLSIASYNIKNLSAIDDEENQKRLKKTGEMINTNLNCPDILGLVEIQDNNGEDFSAGSQAERTINQLVKYIPKSGPCANVSYKSINIDPLSHREGGVPGANIRVALIFNTNRVLFDANPLPTPLTETVVLPNGNLNYNPGRVFPNSQAFKNTRKSIVAQFNFRGEDVFVIVNHFNSKISDTSHFSAIQPIVRNTEVKRSQLARQVNKFTSLIEKRNTNASVAVIGDFNAYVNEQPMKVLEGNNLYNLIRDLPRNQWYTTNHNGNSQALDYIFVNKYLNSKVKSFHVPQINSDFMGRLSDHDPVMSIFKF